MKVPRINVVQISITPGEVLQDEESIFSANYNTKKGNRLQRNKGMKKKPDNSGFLNVGGQSDLNNSEVNESRLIMKSGVGKYSRRGRFKQRDMSNSTLVPSSGNNRQAGKGLAKSGIDQKFGRTPEISKANSVFDSLKKSKFNQCWVYHANL